MGLKRNILALDICPEIILNAVQSKNPQYACRSEEVKKFGLFGKVKFNSEKCFIFGRRATGYFGLRKLDGIVAHRSADCKKLKLLEKKRNTLLIERQVV